MSKKSLSIVGIISIIIFAGAFFFFSRVQEEKASFNSMNDKVYRKVSFPTQDGVTIVGNYYPRRSNIVKGIVLFLHMMPATKESWDTLARELQQRDIVSLAIDLRGHGKSFKQGIKILDYRTFAEKDHQASKLDVEAALDWLDRETALGLEHMSVAGASIGANLALEALGDHPQIGHAVALSPGLNYQGIEPKAIVGRLKPYQSVFYVTSKDDGTNAKEVEELYRATSAKKELKVYEKVGHGTTMLERADDLLPLVVEFLAD